jgi:uncharacterized protein
MLALEGSIVENYSELGSVFISVGGFFLTEKYFEIRDPIHGMVGFNDLEREIINSAPFQRLRRIRQLAWTDLVYPGAMHTRFEHSIGVMHVAGRLFDRLTNYVRSREILKTEFGVTAEDIDRQRQAVRLAALGHDLGHGPFSHAAEELFPKNSEATKRIAHEAYSSEIIKAEISDIVKSHRMSNQLGLDIDSVASFIDGVPKDRITALLKDVVSGTLDADRMDYLLRDAYHCGVRYGQYDLERIVNTIGICEDDEEPGLFRIGINDDGVHAAEGLVIARFMMFTQVYMHKTRTAYDYHFEHCMKELLLQEGGNFSDPYSATSRAAFMNWDDWRVLGLIQQGRGGPHGQIIKDRKHHRKIFETSGSYENARTKERAEEEFKAVKNELEAFECVELLVSKSWYSQKIGQDILVRDASSDKLTAFPLSARSSVVKSLEPVNQRRLYVPYEHIDSARMKVKEMQSKKG